MTGKQWHAPRKAFRPGAGLTSYAQRAQERSNLQAMKQKEKEMKDEKEEERQVGALAFSLSSTPLPLPSGTDVNQEND